MEFSGYGGFWRRFAAIFIDGVILNVGGFILGLLLGIPIGIALDAMGYQKEFITGVSYWIGNVLDFVTGWLYFTLMESSRLQATLGKMALGIAVTDVYGEPISFGKANARHWSKILSMLTLLVGYMMAGFTEKKQALHDMIAGTLVLRKV